MSLATSNRDGGKTSESGHLRPLLKGFTGEVLAGLQVSQRGAGANLSVDVAIGDALIPRSDGTYGHPAWNDAVYNQVITTADVSNPRRDIVVMYIDYGNAVSTAVSNNTNGVVKIKAVAGTPAGSPADPSDAAIQSSVGSGNPYTKLGRVRVGAGVTSLANSVIDDLRTMAQALENGGWHSRGSAWDFWTYSAWDSTNKLATITVPDSTIFTLGQKVRYWQGTGGWKYGFIVKLASSTSIIVYQGHVSGYTLNNERIYLPAYSRDKSPDGFPVDPTVWTYDFTSSSNRTTASPVSGTWYNAETIGVPIGLWLPYLQAILYSDRGTAGDTSCDMTLSTANNTDSSSKENLSSMFTNNNSFQTQSKAKILQPLGVTSNTNHYINYRTNASGSANCGLLGNNIPIKLRLVCAYL